MEKHKETPYKIKPEKDFIELDVEIFDCSLDLDFQLPDISDLIERLTHDIGKHHE